MDEPVRTDDPAEAREHLARDGAVVVTARGVSAEDAVRAAHEVFAGRVLAIPEAAEVRSGAVNDRTARRIGKEEALPAHTDGFAYGDSYPDQILLLCSQSSPSGGESFLVDCEAVADDLAETPEGARLLELLESVPVDQTEEGMRRAVSPVVEKTVAGRRMYRRFPFQRPSADTTDADRDAWIVRSWWLACLAASADAPRFKLLAGDALVLDNYRMLHGREPYDDADRLMWRVWVWTSESNGVPSGLLHSDTRYAGVS
jgi:gamma-butyrobetaine dioxygenase